jgi:leucine dehydrogenase
LEGYDRTEIMRKTENIYTTTIEILNRAQESGVTTHKAALEIAQARIAARKHEHQG